MELTNATLVIFCIITSVALASCNKKILRLNTEISSMAAAILVDSFPSFRRQTGEEGEQTQQTTAMRA